MRVQPPTLPNIPVSRDATEREEWRLRLVRFHLEGETNEENAAEPAASTLWPAALEALLGSGEIEPLEAVVWPDPSTGPACGAAELVRRAIARAGDHGEPLTLVKPHVGLLARGIEQLVAGSSEPQPLADVWARALDALPATGAEGLGREIERLRGALPPGGIVVALGPATIAALYSEAVGRARRPRREAFAGELRALVERLDEQLRIDASHAPEGTTPEALAPALGPAGRQFIDPRSLARRLPRQRGAGRLEPERRERIEQALAELRGYLEQGPREPTALLFVSAQDAAVELPGCRVLVESDPLRAASGWFEATAASLVRVLRALRVARLEVERAFDPRRHAPALERLDWRRLSQDELLLLPAVAVLGCAEEAAEWLAELSALLCSGRPIHVLLEEQVDDAQAALHLSLAQLAVAHRETRVLQSTPVQPAHLVQGLADLARTASTAVAVISTPRWDGGPAPGLQLVAAHAGRSTPCFTFDPSAGESWAERCDVSANLAVERAWPLLTVRDDLVEAFTFAHAMAADLAHAGRFRVVPPEGWSDDLVPLAEWIDAPPEKRRGRLPYVWVVDGDGHLGRAVTTHAVASAALDRARAWRALQELGGVRNEHARRAVEQAGLGPREETAGQARRVEAEHDVAEVERVRLETTRQAMERLVAKLLNLDVAPGAAPAAPATKAQPSAAPTEPVEAARPLDTPYIDSFLCTTCNECTNLNPRMFRYDANKQATIADPTAGTFAQLVKAAEKCPARCIHPGTPRPGDSTGTPAFVARAQAFR